MINTAIVLAGGFGTRLQTVVKDLPKPMAPIADKPFLEYLLQYLIEQKIEKVVLSVGYKWETIRKYFGHSVSGMKLKYSVEDEPLGTGGAIYKAIEHTQEQEFFVLNGDSFFDIDLTIFYSKHKARKGDLSIALKPMMNFDRYGVVRTDSSERIISFEEKKRYASGNINGGIYLLNRSLFSQLPKRMLRTSFIQLFHLFAVPPKFSFEKDVMEKFCNKIPFHGFPFDKYFIDIGIPEDYARAQTELPSLFPDFRLTTHDSPFTTQTLTSSGQASSSFTIDSSWTLFLDRDGVINKKIENDYVRTHKQFEWLEGVQESLVALSKIFGRIIVVSNQQGIGKGYMKNEDVEEIHSRIMNTISKQGGRIDQIYFAPQLKEENSPMRKPEIGMAIQAKKDFPEIDFTKSIMVGDSMSDMEFGKKAGMKTVFISHGKQTPKNELIDFASTDLKDFSRQIAD